MKNGTPTQWRIFFSVLILTACSLSEAPPDQETPLPTGSIISPGIDHLLISEVIEIFELP